MAISQHNKQKLLELQAELSQRQTEALRLYVPNPMQERFHQSHASERLVIGGNRSGKSCCSFVELARAMTGQDPYNKYPKENGIAMCVGRNWQHIAAVMHRYLLRPGSFKIIKDLETGKWRAFNPATDMDRKRESESAPQLIPPRMIKNISWQMKASKMINSLELTNGWTAYFYSSSGEIPQGIAADIVLCDEEIERDEWIPEMQARLADRKGRLWVAAMPHSTSEWLLGLTERAEAEEKEGRTDRIEMFKLRFLDNQHIEEEEREKMIARWAAQGADVLRQRSEGDFTFDSLSVFPTFNMHTHGIDRKAFPDLQIPADWTRYMAIDPGHQVAAALFMAVSPDEQMWVVYDQVYCRQANAEKFAKEIKQHLGQTVLRSMIIDMHGGRLTDIGSGRSVAEQYQQAFAKYDIRSQMTGYSFQLGCDDVAARISAVQSALTVRPSGTPKLRVLLNSVPDLEREMKKYRKKTSLVNGAKVITDVPNERGEVHLCQCLCYLVASEPIWAQPEIKVEAPKRHPLVEAYEKKRQKNSSSRCVFGPAGGSQQEVLDNGAIYVSQWG